MSCELIFQSDEANNLPVQIFMDYWKQRNDKKSEEATHFVKQILNIRPEEKEMQLKPILQVNVNNLD